MSPSVSEYGDDLVIYNTQASRHVAKRTAAIVAAAVGSR